MNNGLEQLDKLMETFYELCEECNCNEDMYQMYNLTSPHHIIRKKLERLEKLEKVVKILKGTSIIVVDKNFMTINTNAIWRNDNSGGYDLLKEVFGNEKG